MNKKTMLYFIISIFCFFSLLLLGTTKVKAYKNIQALEVKEITTNPSSQAILADVRTAEEYKIGHIKRSINIPLQSLKDDIHKSNIHKDTQIIVYCKSGVRAKKAAELLDSMGFTNVYYLGGLNEWPYGLVKD